MVRGEEKGKKSGRFATQTLICRRCGESFETRKEEDLCPACRGYLRQREAEVEGYLFAAQDQNEDSFTGDEAFFDTVHAHREAILEHYRPAAFLAVEDEWEFKVKKYQDLSEQEARDLMAALAEAGMHFIGSSAVGLHCMLPGFYPGVVADFSDVFAVGYHPLKVEVELNAETVIYLLLSNDPYLPAFPFAVALPRDFAERESRLGGSIYADLFTTLCPNLTYPVSPLRELEKTIRQDGQVRGDLPFSVALQWINDAKSGTGNCSICAEMAKMEAQAIGKTVPQETEALMDRFGYVDYSEIHAALSGGNRKARKFWGETEDQVEVLGMFREYTLK